MAQYNQFYVENAVKLESANQMPLLALLTPNRTTRSMAGF